MFYTYIHRRESDGVVFYVGKGQGDRMGSRKSRNRHWRHVAAKHGFIASIVAPWPTEAEALAHEVALIACFRGMGLALVNMTDGGDGVSGHRWSEDQRARHAVGQREKSTQKSRDAASEQLRSFWMNPDARAARVRQLSGDGNPSRRPDVRAKISAGIARGMNGTARGVRIVGYGITFDCMEDAADWLREGGIGVPDASSLSKACRGLLATSRGFRWEYTE